MNFDRIECAVCGKVFKPGNREDGCPNGVGFQMEDGTLINVCADCLLDQNKLEEYFKRVDDGR